MSICILRLSSTVVYSMDMLCEAQVFCVTFWLFAYVNFGLMCIF